MSWRPEEGWDAKKIVEELFVARDAPDFTVALVEAGADALLEALKERGVYCWLDVLSFRGCNRGDQPSEFAPQVGSGHFGKRGDKGWLHFILDEELNEKSNL